MVQNIIKLAVGVDSVNDLFERQRKRLFNYKGEKATTAWTTRRPREHETVIDGGSMYWVIRNYVLVRQHIIGFEPYDEKATSWTLVLSPELVRTHAVARKAFQGWRYLPGDQAPPDQGCFIYGEREDNASPEMREALLAIGLF